MELEELRLLGHHGARIKAAFHKAEPTLKKIGHGIKKFATNPIVDKIALTAAIAAVGLEQELQEQSIVIML